MKKNKIKIKLKQKKIRIHRNRTPNKKSVRTWRTTTQNRNCLNMLLLIIVSIVSFFCASRASLADWTEQATAEFWRSCVEAHGRDPCGPVQVGTLYLRWNWRPTFFSMFHCYNSCFICVCCLRLCLLFALLLFKLCSYAIASSFAFCCFGFGCLRDT